ncbi:putative glutamate carboxypeptidase 2 [Iris pallida]|uniref:glutamate carboxypeptidase II n=1 Tax=Iris pallida TaxID=29817 RepID=A0AAX6EGB2_IRIPA|nr:putative glutamate carboxypeptidase 2 [Iris pallida]
MSVVVMSRVPAIAGLLFLFLYFTATPPSKTTYHSLFLSLSSNYSASAHLHSLTLRPHSSSTPADSIAADYVRSLLSSSSFRSHSLSYDVLLSLPVHRSLHLHLLDDHPFTLLQQTYPGDPYADVSAEALPTFHAYAASGSATGPAVYANYGRLEDFQKLLSMGIDLNGSVVVARYGQIYRGDIVRNAEDVGAAAVVVYSDPADSGGPATFPEGRAMPPTGVQVGSTYRGVGDPTTPGWPSSRSGGTCERLRLEEVRKGRDVPGIPSLPVSASDGEDILRSIGGQVADPEWQGGAGGLLYRVGPGPGVLNLTYAGNDTIATIQNVIAVMEGEEEPDRFVLLGNHRDAWTFGAVDPNSGTAALLELAERLGKLQKRGWRPRRTIILCNWDAEEYGLIGSTEWVEENREMLASRAIAYLNIDSAVSGPGFHVDATPQLDEVIKHAAKKVEDPDNSSQTLYDSWISSGSSPLIGRLGGGSTDFAAFVQHVGVPSVDMFFGGGYPVYHSLYDDFVWMQKFGDPMFHRHVAAASVWGLVALRLADEEFLPFDYLNYASELQLDGLKRECNELSLQKSTKSLEDDVLGMPVSFTPIYRSIKELKKAATKINNQRKSLEGIWSLMWRKDPLKVRELNDRLMMAERAFTDPDGLFRRSWYKHLIYGPSQHNDYGSKSFPGVDDAIQNAKSLNTSESWSFAQHEVFRAARAVTQASRVLSGELT